MPPRLGWTSSCPMRDSRHSRTPGSWHPDRMSRGAKARPSPLIVAVAAVGLAFLVLPLAALAIRAPWADLPRLLTSEPVLQALGLSLLTGLISTAACMV